MSATTVHHVEHGEGTVLHVDSTLPQQQEDPEFPRPPWLLFVRWGAAQGITGGWYDPFDPKLTFENAVGFIKAFPQMTEPRASPEEWAQEHSSRTDHPGMTVSPHRAVCGHCGATWAR